MTPRPPTPTPSTEATTAAVEAALLSSPRNDINPSLKKKPNEKSASSSFGLKRGFLNNNKTTRRAPPPSAIETTSAPSSAAAAAAAAPTEPPPTPTPTPSTPDPQNECVLCAYPLPIKENESLYKECCGESICIGCIIAQKRTLIIGTDVNKPIKGSKEEKDEFMTILLTERTCVCPFCRTEEPTNKKEMLKRFWERIDEYNDPEAMNVLGSSYLEGKYGLSKNLTKAEELFKRSYDLGNPTAAQCLFELYNHHIPDADKVLMMKYLEEGARRGNLDCMYFMASRAAQSGSCATRQYCVAARSGSDIAMQYLMVCYRQGLLSKEDLATTLRAHKAANDQGRSEPREYAMRYWDLHKEMVATGKLTWAYSTGNLE